MTRLLPSAETAPGAIRVGLAGRGILESRTPWMHEQEAAAQGLDLTYELFDFSDRGWADQDLPQLLDELAAAGYAGINVTYPFKQAVIASLDSLSDGAARVAAVNTVSFAQGQRRGFNTDITGFTAGFREGLAGICVGTVLQVGCGGAGSATAHALLGDLGAEGVVLFDTDEGRIARLHGQLVECYGAERVTTTSDLAASAARVDGLLNATPMGMAKFPGLPLPAAVIEARHWVADVVYFPLETALLAAARAKGCRTLDGSGMAVHQAADAFTVFTGLAPDHARMRASFAAFAKPPAGAAAA